MKVILFDLGNTLEDTKHEVLLPGASKTLKAVREMRDAQGAAPALALVSDFGETGATPAQLPAARAEYYAILDRHGIRGFFEPVARRVILSAEVGAEKPSEKIFRAVIDRIDPSLGFKDIFFVTELKPHVTAARALGMRAAHFRGPGQTAGEVKRLPDLVPLFKTFLQAAS
jgi:FMN phosphatase YigB (HAD superfamily)